MVQSAPHKESLLISKQGRFYLANASDPGFYPEVRRWNAHFSTSKLLTQKILKRIGYKVISSVEVRIGNYASAAKLTAHLQKTVTVFPVLVKPDQGLRGRGITVANNIAQLKKSALVNFRNKSDFMLQPILTQKEYRILVVNNEVMLMHSKQNPFVEGNGTATIRELLAEIKESKKDATFISFQHVLHNTKPSSILKKGERFEYHLTKKPTAEFYETDHIPVACKKWALKLAKEINASVIGIDVFIPAGFSKTSTYTIIELNSNPGVNYLPAYCNDTHTATLIFEKVLRDYFEIKNK